MTNSWHDFCNELKPEEYTSTERLINGDTMHTNKILKATTITLTILSFILLAGCGLIPTQQSTAPAMESLPTASPTAVELPKLTETPPPSICLPFTASNDSGTSVITLADGSQLFLGSDTEISLIPAGYCNGSSTHNVSIKKGQVAVHSAAPIWATIVITSPEGHIANIGASGLVTYDASTQAFSLQCSNVNCSLGRDVTALAPVECGVGMSLDINGNPNSMMPVDPAFLGTIGNWLIPQCQVPQSVGSPLEGPTATLEATQTATATGTATPDTFAATATAFCDAFHRIFVTTPCPPLNP
jgi:hypothetical protein